MKKCPFCDFNEGWISNSPWNPNYFVIKCNVCGATGPEGKTEESAEKKWDRYLTLIDPLDKIEFEEALNEFERTNDPMKTLNLGKVNKILNNTKSAYSFNRYEEDEWVNIIKWLFSLGYTDAEVEAILLSKIMRWTADDRSPDLKGLKEFAVKYKTLAGKNLIEDFLDNEIRNINENVGAPMATLGNVPGGGNATPASTAAMSGAQQTSNSSIGSGDKWNSSMGPYSQTGKPKRKRKKRKVVKTKRKNVSEENISPYDKLGVAMAKKMKVPMVFKKGKGKKDVEQIEIDESYTTIKPLEDWIKTKK